MKRDTEISFARKCLVISELGFFPYIIPLAVWDRIVLTAARKRLAM